MDYLYVMKGPFRKKNADTKICKFIVIPDNLIEESIGVWVYLKVDFRSKPKVNIFICTS